VLESGRPVGDERAFFRDQDGPWAEYLGRAAGARGTAEPWIPARNFLLDEGVTAERAEVYVRTVGAAGTSGDWTQRHSTYLAAEVRLPQPANGFPKTLDPARHDRCPATFRTEENFRAFGSAFNGLYLLRVVEVPWIANRAGVDVSRLLAAGRAQVAGRANEDDVALLASSFRLWQQAGCDQRPTYATFQVDHLDLFKTPPAEDAPDWADTLRDRLGLTHFDPGRSGSPFPVFVFRYPVGSVPTRKDWPHRPLAVPTVLDLALQPAFCPAPREDECGRVVHLGAPGEAPGREVLHPFRVVGVEDLFRGGEVRAPVPADLWPARRAHLRALRAAGRSGYAEHTDPDLEAP
jgi:hypothetical protein